MPTLSTTSNAKRPRWLATKVNNAAAQIDQTHYSEMYILHLQRHAPSSLSDRPSFSEITAPFQLFSSEKNAFRSISSRSLFLASSTLRLHASRSWACCSRPSGGCGALLLPWACSSCPSACAARLRFFLGLLGLYWPNLASSSWGLHRCPNASNLLRRGIESRTQEGRKP